MRRPFLIVAMATAAVASAAEPGYVNTAACRPCHTAIYDSYSRTGMARTFRAATAVLMARLVTPGSATTTRLS